MPQHPHPQSTDTENNRPLLPVKNPGGGEVKSVSLGSFDDLAESSRTGVHPKEADQTTADVPAEI